jgi:predicted transcriptional regulator
MAKQNVNFKTDSEKVKTLDHLGLAMRRDRTFLLNEALDQYLAVQQYHLDEIAEGLAQVTAGKTRDYEKVRAAWLRRLGR